MSKENTPQAILTKAGRKALKGDTEGVSAPDVRRKGLRRLAARTGVTALVSTVVLGAAAYGINKQESVSAAQTRADKIAFGGTKFGSNPGGSEGKGASGSTSTAPETSGDTSATPDSTPTPDSTGTGSTEASGPAASPDAPIPAQGDWTPTPGATPIAPTTETGPAPQTPDMGGVAPDTTPPTGGIEPK